MINRTQSPEIKEIGNVKLPQINENQLDNGIKIYSLNTDVQIVKLVCAFRVGSWHQDKLLVATSTNKMLTEGTKTLTASEINASLEYNAAFLKKSTGYHLSKQILLVLEKNFNNVVDIIADIIMNPTFPQKELNTYKRTGKHSLSIDFDKVDYLAQIHFHKILFGDDHPYGVYAIPEDYDKITSNDLKTFHQNYYDGSNCFIILVAKNPEDKINLLNKHLSQIKTREQLIKEKQYSIKPSKENKITIEKPGSVQSAIRIGNITINRYHKDYIDLLITNTVLGGYFGSRLMKSIREEKGLTYGIYSKVHSLKYAGVFNIVSEIKKEKIDLAIDEIFKQIELLKTQPIDNEELTKVKNYLFGRFLSDFDGEFKISNYILNMVYWGLEFNYIQKIIKRLKVITPDEIQQVAKKYLNPEKMKITIVG